MMNPQGYPYGTNLDFDIKEITSVQLVASIITKTVNFSGTKQQSFLVDMALSGFV